MSKKNLSEFSPKKASPKKGVVDPSSTSAGGESARKVIIVPKKKAAAVAKLTAPLQDDLTSSDYYFNAYAHFGEHEKLLRDQTRTMAFMKSIMDNKALFQGKTVLDVGCGMGILSLFCAKAGAARVVGVECSDVIVHAENIVRLNDLSNVITLIKGKIEEVTLPVEKVDIIVCDWLGYFLLQESVVDVLIFARDKYLKEGGLIFPERASLHVMGIEDSSYSEKRDEFWGNVYGFNMTTMRELTVVEPLVDSCTTRQVATDSCVVLEIDAYKVSVQQLMEIHAQYTLRAVRTEYMHAIVAYFVAEFPAPSSSSSSSSKGPPRVVINTAPGQKPTHWKQTVFCLTEPLMVYANDVIVGTMTIRRNPKSARDLAVQLSAAVNNDYGDQTQARAYRLL